MLRSGIPYDVWLRQPDRAIETAIDLYNEQSEHDAAQSDQDGSYSG